MLQFTESEKYIFTFYFYFFTSELCLPSMIYCKKEPLRMLQYIVSKQIKNFKIFKHFSVRRYSKSLDICCCRKTMEKIRQRYSPSAGSQILFFHLKGQCNESFDPYFLHKTLGTL